MKSSGSKMTCVVPSRYGVFSWYRTLPFGVSDKRCSEIAGLESDDGDEVTGSCCGASLRDYGRFGQLMLNYDVTPNGERVLPVGWMRESTAPSAPNFHKDIGARPCLDTSSFTGYGYLWWVDHPGSFMALGAYGQWIHVEPDDGLVFVMVGAMPR